MKLTYMKPAVPRYLHLLEYVNGLESVLLHAPLVLLLRLPLRTIIPERERNICMFSFLFVHTVRVRESLRDRWRQGWDREGVMKRERERDIYITVSNTYNDSTCAT